MRKTYYEICLSVFCLLLLALSIIASEDEQRSRFTGFSTSSLSENQIKTLESFHKLEGVPAYQLNFYSDYYFDEYLLVGGNAYVFVDGFIYQNNSAITCSSFSAKTPEGEALHCYNQDEYGQWHAMVYYTSPEGAYRSIAQTRSDFIFSRDFFEDPGSILNRDVMLAAPYCPFDAMNEWGLCVSPLFVDGDRVEDPDKVTLSILGTSRLILDYAKNVDEAIALLDQYNNEMGQEQHLLISDIDGNSAVIEYLRGGLVATRNPSNHQICTNFRIDGYGDSFDNGLSSSWRYRSIEEDLQEYDGVVTEEQAFTVLQNAHQNPAQGQGIYTLWSSVINKTRGTMKVCYHRDYNDVRQFDLPMAVDLGITKLVIDKRSYKPGKRVKINVSVLNNSPRYSQSGKLKFYLSKNSKIGKKSILMGTTDLKALQNNESMEIRFRAKLSKDQKEGEYFLIARIEELPNTDYNSENDLKVCSQRVIIMK